MSHRKCSCKNGKLLLLWIHFPGTQKQRQINSVVVSWSTEYLRCGLWKTIKNSLTWVLHSCQVHLGSLGSLVLLVEHGWGQSVGHLHLVGDGGVVLGVVKWGIGEHLLGISWKIFDWLTEKYLMSVTEKYLNWINEKYMMSPYFSSMSPCRSLAPPGSWSSAAWSLSWRTPECCRSPRTQVRNMVRINSAQYYADVSRVRYLDYLQPVLNPVMQY